MCKYAVVDLEMCKVPHGVRKDRFRWARETIQIGAVLLNESLEIIDEFVTYVAPQYGLIDTFINNLTGISRGDVAKAPEMKEALHAFAEWLPGNTKLVSWSNNDEVQIRHEIKAKSIFIDGFDELLDNWIDCQKIFAEKMNNQRCYKLSEALVAADINYEDGAHDGLVDAYNTALLFAKMEREPQLILNSYYKRAVTDKEDSFGFSLGNVFAGIDLSEFAVA
ncbi:MAG: exonuclease domain-containing protein [Lachnospiraceae bacterium]|nr:exonuclease domain-containing protein [Lachnospiraceae bacterium]